MIGVCKCTPTADSGTYTDHNQSCGHVKQHCMAIVVRGFHTDTADILWFLQCHDHMIMKNIQNGRAIIFLMSLSRVNYLVISLSTAILSFHNYKHVRSNSVQHLQ